MFDQLAAPPDAIHRYTPAEAGLMRFALIGALAERFQEQGVALASSALQNVVYFLQTVKGIDCGYEFEFYTSGPSSASLASDVNVAAALNAVTVSFVSNIGDYEITPSAGLSAIRERVGSILESFKPAVDEVVRDFSAAYANDLSLDATLVYVARSEAGVSDDALTEIMRKLRPRVANDSIASAIDQLRAKRYL